MSWFFEITTPGPASFYATSSFSEHLYVYEEETPSGHSYFYLGSPHFNMITDPTRAIYRGRSLIAVFNSVQRLSYSIIWRYDESSVFKGNHRYDLSLRNENIALEELTNPFQGQELQERAYNHQYHNYLNLAATNDLIHNVLLLLDDAYKYAQFFYINLYKIVETIKNDWSLETMTQYSFTTKTAYDFLNSSNVRGYMNQYIASGLFSRHGFTGTRTVAPNVLNPPPISTVKENLLCLINGWINYKINSNQITYQLKP